MRWSRLAATALAAFAFVALAQDAATTVTVAESEEHGPYLTDGDGNSLYLFVNEEIAMGAERMTEGVREEAAPCSDGCLEAWPPLTGEPTAGEGIDPELLYTADVNGTMQVVYNGWPLYAFARDEAPGDTNGQGVGGPPNVWYLVTPEGHPAGAAMMDDGMDDDGMDDDAGDDAGGEDGDGGEGGDDGD